MRKGAIFIVLALLLMLGAAPVYANGIPPLPQAFYGDVTINGDPAPAGTTIEARGEGVLTGIEGNPITTTESGKYGKAGALEPKLIVQGDILDGATITFYVDGVSTGQTAEWHSGETTEQDLTVTIPPTIGYSPSSFSFTANEGGANPPSQTLSVTNSGVNPTAMDWAVTDDATWLSLSPTSGSSSGEVDSVTLSVDISGMSAGNYSATITISGTGATNTPRTVAVSLAISAPITGQVEVTVPAGQTDYVVDASDIADTTITADTLPGLGDVTITVKKYASNPHPEVTPPADMVPKYIDIEVVNPDAVAWPMYVEQTYTDAEVAGLVESSLGMYYYKAGAWHRCSDTGVNTAANYVWANMIKDELSGSPVAIGGTAAPAPEEEAPAPVGGGGGAPPPAPPAGTTDVRGMVSVAGVFLSSVTAISEDELCTLTIPEGTVGLTEELEPLDEIAMLIMDEPPAPPEDTHVIGLAYDFGPDGATFDPAITLEFSYDPADIPEGVAEEDLVLAYYDEAVGEWVELEGCVVDTENNTITASVSHFTTFAIIGAVTPLPAPAVFSVSNLTVQPAEVEPNETVTIRLSVANTGGTEGSYSVILKINGVKEEEKSVTVAAGSSEDVSFSVIREEAASYSVVVDGLSGSFTIAAPAPLEKPPINWPVLGGIIAGVVVVGLLLFLLIRRRAY